MKILVSGASGMVGSALLPRLKANGHEVGRLARSREEGTVWDQAALKAWSRPDAVIHLAGESIGGRWTEAKKQRIRESRVKGTEELCRAVHPRIFIGASAVGFYGNRADEVLTEASGPGSDFLAEVCVAWERLAEPLAREGTRVVHLRFGMILSGEGGALARMLPLFRLGLGGKLGSGQQWLSWITLHDVVRLIEFCLNHEMFGPLNALSPNPVTNEEFTRALADALHRPAVLPAPAFALRIVFGEMADALLLTSVRAIPARIESTNFKFEHPTIAALEETL
jgi:uncharacterized protein